SRRARADRDSRQAGARRAQAPGTAARWPAWWRPAPGARGAAGVSSCRPPSTSRLPKMREDLFAQETDRAQDLGLLHAWPLDADDQRGHSKALTIARDLLADALSPGGSALSCSHCR